jgi:DNA-binding FadR family transcriptional regulator
MARRAEISVPPIKALKKSELIARELRNQIIRGDIEEGGSLPPEAELMAQFGISRPTLREALRILESDSLITIQRGAQGGAVACKPGPDQAAKHFGLVLQTQDTSVADVFRARQLIEPPAVRVVVEEAYKKAPELLGDIVAQQQQAIDKHDIALARHYTTRFHEGIIRLTGNNTLLLVMQMLNEVYYRHMSAEYMAADDFRGEADVLKACQLSVKAHKHLIGLISDRDSDGATTYWRDHLAKVRKMMFQHHESMRVIDILD